MRRAALHRLRIDPWSELTLSFERKRWRHQNLVWMSTWRLQPTVTSCSVWALGRL